MSKSTYYEKFPKMVKLLFNVHNEIQREAGNAYSKIDNESDRKAALERFVSAKLCNDRYLDITGDDEALEMMNKFNRFSVEKRRDFVHLYTEALKEWFSKTDLEGLKRGCPVGAMLLRSPIAAPYLAMEMGQIFFEDIKDLVIRRSLANDDLAKDCDEYISLNTSKVALFLIRFGGQEDFMETFMGRARGFSFPEVPKDPEDFALKFADEFSFHLKPEHLTERLFKEFRTNLKDKAGRGFVLSDSLCDSALSGRVGSDKMRGEGEACYNYTMAKRAEYEERDKKQTIEEEAKAKMARAFEELNRAKAGENSLLRRMKSFFKSESDTKGEGERKEAREDRSARPAAPSRAEGEPLHAKRGQAAAAAKKGDVSRARGVAVGCGVSSESDTKREMERKEAREDRSARPAAPSRAEGEPLHAKKGQAAAAAKKGDVSRARGDAVCGVPPFPHPPAYNPSHAARMYPDLSAPLPVGSSAGAGAGVVSLSRKTAMVVVSAPAHAVPPPPAYNPASLSRAAAGTSLIEPWMRDGIKGPGWVERLPSAPPAEEGDVPPVSAVARRVVASKKAAVVMAI